MKNFLLTYTKTNHSFSFAWFDTEDELNDFIEENKDDILEIMDAIEIYNARELDL